MQCSYFDAGLCRSCTIIETPYQQQLADKDARVRGLLAGQPTTWLPAVASPQAGYRNKAKMVVGGTAEAPTLGILDDRGRGIDLRECGICSPGITAALPAVAAFITRAGLVPYDVPDRRGELKHVLVTESPSGELLLRFVLRSPDLIPAIRSELGWLMTELPQVCVVSVNLQPEHKAILEGPDEVVLTERETLSMRLGAVDLHLRPQSFFQVNTAVAADLYAQAAAWVNSIAPSSVWDLYCGVGGFALHVAAADRTVTGVETSVDAVASAQMSALDAGLTGARFEAADATRYAVESADRPELVIVNPPRRGIGGELAGWLEGSGIDHVIYSSCNPTSFVKDLAAMPSYRVRQARVLDMFPNTTHLEVITLLERTA